MAKIGIEAGDIVQVTVVVQDNEQTALNRFYYLGGIVTNAGGTEEDTATAYDTMIAPLIKPVVNNNAEYRGVLVQKIFPGSIPARRGANANAGSGTAGATSLPRQTAGLTTWQTDLAKQAFRGRTYWPFPATAHDTGDGIPTSLYKTAINTMNNAILSFGVFPGNTGSDSTAATFVLYHRVTHTSTPISVAITSGFWATQKRRGSRGKPNVPPI